jgi:hypothetical protein
MPPTFRIEGVDCKVVFIYVQWRRNSRVVLTNYGRSAAPRPGMFARGRRDGDTDGSIELATTRANARALSPDLLWL